jgi:hypothetical protein
VWVQCERRKPRSWSEWERFQWMRVGFRRVMAGEVRVSPMKSCSSHFCRDGTEAEAGRRHGLDALSHLIATKVRRLGRWWTSTSPYGG